MNDTKTTLSPGTGLHITVSGVVQGVGFRPFVYGLALDNRLKGFVRNAGGLVEIEVQGERVDLEQFLLKLKNEPPALACIESIEVSESELAFSSNDFDILESSSSILPQQKFVPADSATCQDCLREVLDKGDRRYRYPFTNCTNCGPRFTIIKGLPYDRSATTMAEFAMCEACRREYNDPLDRRFHAQPNACPLCGPTLTFRSSVARDQGVAGNEAALAATVEALRSGAIIAIKGLGGFHLCCDAQNDQAVAKLRKRKMRAAKPFAVMMPDVQSVRQYCLLSKEECDWLEDRSRPIVLLRTNLGTNSCANPSLSQNIAPHNNYLGVMLPYTPLHHILLRDFAAPLVATSGNMSEEPIAISNEEALTRLGQIADGFLLHDRNIESCYDDSVTRIFLSEKMILRRSRGLAPIPLNLPYKAEGCVLACGGQLKNTFCLVSGDKAYVSQHIGDLENLETYENFTRALANYQSLFALTPSLVAHDRHPDYLSTTFAEQYAKERHLPCLAVQHHHAHIVSCMVENGLRETVIGVAFDGLGYGEDETLWGGEFLLANYRAFERQYHFKAVPMPGGTLAIKEPWRMALSYIYSEQSDEGLGASGFAPVVEALVAKYGSKTIDLIKSQVAKGINAPLTSSCGRLFDALSALLGVCAQASYEGQAAIELEALAQESTVSDQFLFDNTYPIVMSTAQTIDPYCILLAAYRDFQAGTSASLVAAKFHATIAQTVLNVCQKIRQDKDIGKVCLSGGVFQNVVLLRMVKALLERANFQVYSQKQLPANDGGLSLGQATIALAMTDSIKFIEECC